MAREEVDNPQRGGWTQNPEAVRESIVQTAQEIFARHDLSSACMEEIAAHTRTSKCMLFYYFKDKKGLYHGFEGCLFPYAEGRSRVGSRRAPSGIGAPAAGGIYLRASSSFTGLCTTGDDREHSRRRTHGLWGRHVVAEQFRHPAFGGYLPPRRRSRRFPSRPDDAGAAMAHLGRFNFRCLQSRDILACFRGRPFYGTRSANAAPSCGGHDSWPCHEAGPVRRNCSAKSEGGDKNDKSADFSISRGLGREMGNACARGDPGR
ncbi:helix-turn-helix transcriptional regulator [Sagittula sp. NFXS13]